MSAIQNEFGISLESAAHSEEDQDNASWKQYLERRSLVLQFLHSNLSPHHLQHHQENVELLKKSYFYLEVEPKQVVMRDQTQPMHHANIFQLINPCQFQRMKKVGKTQVEIQLSLLTGLLEQLERGQEELSSYVETCDMATFLSQWDLIMQKMSKLSEFLEKFLSLQTPGKLYVKHRLVFPLEASLRGAVLPNIHLFLSTKTPLIFDRKESFALKDGARLKWFTKSQESHLERYELHVKLLTSGSPTEVGYGRILVVTSNTCTVLGLQPDRSYEFTVRRSVTHTLVFQQWHDCITLKTKADAVKDVASSACALEG